MATVYIPRAIETAEQAEALPHGSILRITSTFNLDPTEFIDATAFKAGDVWWSDGKTIEVSELVGWTALVPVEAEKQHFVDNDGEPITHYEAWLTREDA